MNRLNISGIDVAIVSTILLITAALLIPGIIHNRSVSERYRLQEVRFTKLAGKTILISGVKYTVTNHEKGADELECMAITASGARFAKIDMRAAESLLTTEKE